jgi:hypothetical protein
MLKNNKVPHTIALNKRKIEIPFLKDKLQHRPLGTISCPKTHPFANNSGHADIQGSPEPGMGAFS